MKFALFLGNAGHSSGGPEVYEVELVRALARLESEDHFHLMCLFPGARKLLGALPENFTCHTLRPSVRAVSMTVTLPWMLSRIQPQAVHSTFMAPPLVLQPHLLTLVCLSMFERPDFYPPAVRLRLQALTKSGLKRSQHVLCVSETLRDCAVEMFQIPSERISVVPLGVHPRFREYPPAVVRTYLDAQGIRQPYFLFSGRWERRKNLLGAIEAFALFKRETRLPHKLVLSGKRTWIETEVMRRIADLELQDEVIDHGKTPLDELPLLYAGATALVYASFYESFGFPILEAMACGAPVITSNVTAMPETAGGAAILVDPYKPALIAEAMHNVATNAELAADRTSAGLRRAANFAWEKTAQASLEAYRRAAITN